MAPRAASSVVGVVLLTALTVLAATAVGAAVVAHTPTSTSMVHFDVAVDAGGEIRVTHAGGDPVDPDEMRVRIRVDGEALVHQPPVPFFSARGFESGPTGPFNSATEGEWRGGETATLHLAGTNDPLPHPGATMDVRIYVADSRVARVRPTVQDSTTPIASYSGLPSSAYSSEQTAATFFGEPPSSACSDEPPSSASYDEPRSTAPDGATTTVAS